MAFEDHIIRYLDGPLLIESSVEGLSEEQLKTRCEPGRWSILEVVCHFTDFEIVYADRIKRILAEDNPTLMSGDPDDYAKTLAYHDRSLSTELAVIKATRAHMAEILRTLTSEQWEFTGTHSRDGQISIQELVERITGHIPHHLKFVEEKKKNLG
jgi:HSP90 family molecular chaperone